MRSFFHKQFEEEFLDSEKLRVTILVGFFALGSSFAGFNYFRATDVSPELQRGMATSLVFLIGMTVFELFALLFVTKQINQGYRAIPVWLQYLNAFLEISSPAFIMAFLANSISTPSIVLHSPIVYLYFIFITLSTLRLDFKITLFISVVGALEFLGLSVYVGESFRLQTMDQLPSSHVAMIAKTTVILISGLGAAFVARQIRKEIDRSLAVAEKGSKIVNLFGQQISREIVDEMLEGNGHIPSKLMRVCVMFIDIRNFTTYVSDKTPVEIVAYQNAFFSVVIDAVTRNRGIVNQFLGDGCMITFGAPVQVDNACQNALTTALEVRENLTRQALEGLIPATTIGVGIHVGEVVTGNIGTDIRQQYSITGSPVILAARLEQLNKEFKSQILISQEVMMEVKEVAKDSENLGEVRLKGWDKPMMVYKVA